MTVTEPYGVVAAITPWNFPARMAGWKLGPALAAGNAVFDSAPFFFPSPPSARPSSRYSAVRPGIVNVVLGDGQTTGTALTGHPGVAKVSFTLRRAQEARRS